MPHRTPEDRICRAIRALLDTVPTGEQIPDSPEVKEIAIGLEYFLPPTLAEVYPYWKGEGLDGVFIEKIAKANSDEVNIAGRCILITDQTVTPLTLDLRISKSANVIEWMECRLGQRGNGKGGMQRVPYRKSRYVGDFSSIDWVYQISFGEK